MRTSLLIVAFLAMISVSYVAGNDLSADMQYDDDEWIQPAFVESLEESHEIPMAMLNRAWHRVVASRSSSALQPEMHHSFAEHSSSVQAEAEMTAEARLAATITAEGKTHAELLAEVELKSVPFWNEFKARFRRVYRDEKARFLTFSMNLIRIAKLNAKAFFSKINRSLRAVYSHLTPHADRTAAEFKLLLNAKVEDPNQIAVSPKTTPRVIAGRTSFLELGQEQAPACSANGQDGTCIDESTCTGTTYSGHCAGAANIKCCVPSGAPAPATPSAPATPVAPATPATPAAPSGPVVPPVDVDWRSKGTPIKNQGQCGSCYAFASAEVLESAWNIKTGHSLTLSPQQLMDCVKGANACNGGSPMVSLMWWQATSGAVTEDLIPYLEKPSGSCTMAKDKMPQDSPQIKPSSVSWAIPYRQPKQDENEMGHQLSAHGPMTVVLDANSFQFYQWGVMGAEMECSNDPGKCNHVVALEGLGTDDKTGQRYWIIRNSWSDQWGENGRGRMAYDQNICGVANWVTKITV